MDNLSREAFTAVFNEEFAANMAKGLDKTQAAAQALTTAQRLLVAQSSPPSKSYPRVKEHVEVLPIVPVKPVQEVRISVEILKKLLQECEQTSSYTPVIRLVGEVFSSPDKLGVCFIPHLPLPVPPSSEEKKDCNSYMSGTESRNLIGLDLKEVSAVYGMLREYQQHSEGIGNSLRHAMEGLTYQLLSSPPSAHPLRLYVVVLEYPFLMEASFSQVLRNLLQALDRVPSSGRSQLTDCFRENALSLVGENNDAAPRFMYYLKLLKQYIIQRLDAGSVQDIRYAVRAISLLHDAAYNVSVPSPDEKEDAPTSTYDTENLAIKLGLTTSSFYLNEMCSEYMASSEGRKREYKLWRVDLDELKKESAGLYQCQSMISFPYVLTPATKAAVLELDANVEMRQVVSQEYNQAVASGSRYMIPYLVLRIRRSHIMEDTLNHFVANTYTDSDFKKPLKVVFDNEEGIDEGGVRKEYYQIMMKHLLDPNYGMFKYYEESRLLWFNSDSFESHLEFELIGILLGVAIYNSIIVEFHMPKCIYRKLIGLSCTLEDLRELQPDLAKGLDQILKCDDPVQFAELFGDMCFQITYEMLGEKRAIDLKPNGGEESVTFENRSEYVSLYVSYLLEDSVESQFSAFAQGFRKVCGGAALDLFNAEELELLICGNPKLDTLDLQRGTRYEDGYSGDEEVVSWFWEVLHDFSEENKRSFLRFISGSDRSPIDGLSKLHFVISRNGDDESRLPSAHTCFNHMLLPQYKSKDMLRLKLLYAMHNAAEGFGLL